MEFLATDEPQAVAHEDLERDLVELRDAVGLETHESTSRNSN
jgi:hypothetical protein